MDDWAFEAYIIRRKLRTAFRYALDAARQRH
jgi:hypothetical protein